MRRLLNIRTSKEINHEKYILKLINGTFDKFQKVSFQDLENLKQAMMKN